MIIPQSSGMFIIFKQGFIPMQITRATDIKLFIVREHAPI